ncbi:MAG: hypothetical protein J5I93_29895 [Pirellulaceae bacterium]|nr:hypothetical protein [Pirellulaceae bacterium]
MATYWEIGRRIVEFEQGGEARAEYGAGLLKRLGKDLTARFGRGFSERNLRQMRAFHQGWDIWQTPSAKFEASACGCGFSCNHAARADRIPVASGAGLAGGRQSSTPICPSATCRGIDRNSFVNE